MSSFTSTSKLRSRLSAVAVAFAVVAGGAFATAAPAFAETTTPTPPASTTPAEYTPSVTAPVAVFTVSELAEGTSVSFQGEGFAPNVAAQVTVSFGDSDPAAVTPDAIIGEDGLLEYNAGVEPGDITAAGPYTFTFTQTLEDGSTVTASATIEVIADEAPAPSAITDKSVYQPSETVAYLLENFTPGAVVELSIDGPATGVLRADVGEDGTVAGEIVYNEYNADTGEVIRQVDFPIGVYTVTVTEVGSDLTASFTFEVVDPNASDDDSDDSASDDNAAGGGSSADGSDQLATTGAEDVFGIAGLGLLAATAGLGMIALRRRSANNDA